MKTCKLLLLVLSIIVFSINIVIAIGNKSIHDALGWCCTLLLSTSILTKH